MKLAISTLGCPNWDFMRILKEYKALGVEGIEVRGLDGEMDAEKIVRFKDENTAETLALVSEYGLTLAGFGSSVSFHDAAKFDSNMAAGKRTVDICAKLGFPSVRVFGDAIPDKEKTAEITARVIRGFTELSAYAADKGIGVNMETHGDFHTAELMAPIVDALIKQPAFGILWDIEHSDKTYGADYRTFYNVIKPLVRHLHFKDYRRLADGKTECCAVGEGVIPLADIVAQLTADGYNGYYSLEWEKKWHPELEEPEVAFPHYVKFMRSL